MDKDIKKTGYILLGLGLTFILGALVQIFLVLNGRLKPVGVFNFNSSDFAIDGQVLFPQLPANITNDLQVELFPAELINTSLNLGFNTAFVFILIFAGGKIAGIGTSLLRPIYLKKNEA